MLDMMNMMGKVKEMQARLRQAQDNLGNVRTTGEAGGGWVKATANGKKQLVSIEIDPAILKAEDQTTVQDLVVAAVNKALEDAEVLAKEELKKSTEGILPNIPGLDLSSFIR